MSTLSPLKLNSYNDAIYDRARFLKTVSDLMSFMREEVGPLLPVSQQINQYLSNHDQSEAQHGGSTIQMDPSGVVCSVSLHNSGQHSSDSIMLEEPVSRQELKSGQDS